MISGCKRVVNDEKSREAKQRPPGTPRTPPRVAGGKLKKDKINMKLQNLIHILIGIACVGLLPNARPVAAQSRRVDDAPLAPNSNVQEAWVARYNSGEGGNEAYAIAVDGSGNVYVTGQSYTIESWYDYATIKYNSAGQQQWVARHNGPWNDNDYAVAIAVDNSGNVYVTGGSRGDYGYVEYGTIKYDSAGQEQWVARHSGPAGEYASAIAVDGSGNVYVTGRSRVGNSFREYATIKYDSAGQEQWVARHSGSNAAPAIALDSSGNIYVTGGSTGLWDSADYATIKYNSAGQEQWVARYDGGTNDDYASAIAIDGSDNVYVTGKSRYIDSSNSYATIKYNSGGEEQWVARYIGPAGGSDDEATGIAVDSSGNVYVTGRSYASTGYGDYATLKYNSAGQQQWVDRYNGPGNNTDQPVAIALDSLGNVYVTGYSYGPSNNGDYATVKYDSAGQEQWVTRYNGFGTSEDVTCCHRC